MTAPPRLALWLLALAAPQKAREAVLGDVVEEYRTRARSSPTEARRWVWIQAITSIPSWVVYRGPRSRVVWGAIAASIGMVAIVSCFAALNTELILEVVRRLPHPYRLQAAHALNLLALACGGLVAGRVSAEEALAPLVLIGLVLVLAPVPVGGGTTSALMLVRPGWALLSLASVGMGLWLGRSGPDYGQEARVFGVPGR